MQMKLRWNCHYDWPKIHLLLCLSEWSKRRGLHAFRAPKKLAPRKRNGISFFCPGLHVADLGHVEGCCECKRPRRIVDTYGFVCASIWCSFCTCLNKAWSSLDGTATLIQTNKKTLYRCWWLWLLLATTGLVVKLKMDVWVDAATGHTMYGQMQAATVEPSIQTRFFQSLYTSTCAGCLCMQPSKHHSDIRVPRLEPKLFGQSKFCGSTCVHKNGSGSMF